MAAESAMLMQMMMSEMALVSSDGMVVVVSARE